MSNHLTKLDSDDYEAATLRLQCAEQLVSTLVTFALNQRDNSILINANVLGEAMHGIELLLSDSRKLLNNTTLGEVTA